MASERVIIAGGGVSGLVAAHVFAKRGRNPVVLEPRSLGGDFLSGGLKYIHKTQGMADLFDELELPWSDYNINGGILLRGTVEPYPKCFAGMDEEESTRIQADHFRKTRHTEPGGFGSKAMNDPAAARTSRRAIRCDFRDMVKRMGNRTKVLNMGVQKIDSKRSGVQLTNGEWVGYDKLILTIPLWIIRQMADFYVPQGMAMALNLIQVKPRRDRFARWDYVYTPYTPADSIHRFSPSGSGYSMEINGEWERQEANAVDDLAFIFEDGFVVERIKVGLKGHLLELQEQPEWPSNVVPLGRFAKWEPRATTDVTLEEVTRLAERWGWKER